MGIPTAEGDIYIMESEIEGVTFHNGTGIFMPRADVSINITRTATRLIEISFSGLYTIETNITQNTTMAFVYPNSTSESHIENYIISLNGSVTNYTIYEWNELDFEYPSDVVDMTGEWILHAKYAAFNVELLGNTTCIIHVSHQDTFSSNGHEFWYNYIVESARSFCGNTHQTVYMKLVEEEPFLESEFFPNTSLTQWHDNNTTHATWDFIVQESNIEQVRLQAVMTTYQGSGSSSFYLPTLILGMIVLVAILGTVIYKKYQM